MSHVAANRSSQAIRLERTDRQDRKESKPLKYKMSEAEASPEGWGASVATRSRFVRSIIPQPPRKRNWMLVRNIVGAIFVAALVLATTQPWNFFRSSPANAASANHSAESNSNQALPGAPTTGEHDGTESVRSVKVERPTPATTADVVLPATIRPWQSTTLHARASGYLLAWHKDLGARVKAGELLAEIETPELDQELAEGVALAREAAAAAVQARAEREEAAAELNVTRALLTKAQAEFELTNLQFARRTQLLAKGAISREEYETFQKEVEARNADVQAAKADVARRETSLRTRAAVIDAREATANSRLSNVDRLKELQAFKRIVAPFDGVVTRRLAEVGMLVTAGKEELFTLEDMNRVRVQAYVPQANSVQTRVGTPAVVTLPETAGTSVSGEVTRVAESVDSTNRTMLAEIELDNTDRLLQPGSYMHVSLKLPQDTSTWTIPTNTVQMRVDGAYVVLVNAKGEVEARAIRLGRDLGNRVLVIDGIRGDERLILNPSDDLTPGLRVEVRPTGKQASDVAQR